MVRVRVIEILRLLSREKAYRELSKEIIKDIDNEEKLVEMRQSYIKEIERRGKIYEENLIKQYARYSDEIFQLIFEGELTRKINKVGVPADYLVADYYDEEDGYFHLFFHHYHTKEDALKGIEALIKGNWVLSPKDLYVIQEGKEIIDFVLAVDKNELRAKVRWCE